MPDDSAPQHDPTAQSLNPVAPPAATEGVHACNHPTSRPDCGLYTCPLTCPRHYHCNALTTVQPKTQTSSQGRHHELILRRGAHAPLLCCSEAPTLRTTASPGHKRIQIWGGLCPCCLCKCKGGCTTSLPPPGTTKACTGRWIRKHQPVSGALQPRSPAPSSAPLQRRYSQLVQNHSPLKRQGGAAGVVGHHLAQLARGADGAG